jgi:hypothetical protein
MSCAAEPAHLALPPTVRTTGGHDITIHNYWIEDKENKGSVSDYLLTLQRAYVS